MKADIDIEATCHKKLQIIEDRICPVENQLQNIDSIINEKVKHEVHGQLNSDTKTIKKDIYKVIHLGRKKEDGTSRSILVLISTQNVKNI